MTNETTYGILHFRICVCGRKGGVLPRISLSDRNDKSDNRGGRVMLDYEKELKNFKPSLEVEEIEDAVYQEDLSDMTDLLKQVMDQKTK